MKCVRLVRQTHIHHLSDHFNTGELINKVQWMKSNNFSPSSEKLVTYLEDDTAPPRNPKLRSSSNFGSSIPSPKSCQSSLLIEESLLCVPRLAGGRSKDPTLKAPTKIRAKRQTTHNSSQTHYHKHIEAYRRCAGPDLETARSLMLERFRNSWFCR